MVFLCKLSKVGNSKAINIAKNICDDKNIEVGDLVTLSIGNSVLKRKVIKNKLCKAITLKKSFCERIGLKFRDKLDYDILEVEKDVDDVEKEEFARIIQG